MIDVSQLGCAGVFGVERRTEALRVWQVGTLCVWR